jgi:hypothetical protein
MGLEILRDFEDKSKFCTKDSSEKNNTKIANKVFKK